MTQPVQEPTAGRDQAATDFRTRQLFRRPSEALLWEDVGSPGALACGIQFNSGTYGPENVGDYLHVTTTDEISILAGTGVPGSGPKIDIMAVGGFLTLQGDDVIVESPAPGGVAGQVKLITHGGTIELQSNDGGVYVEAGGGLLSLYAVPSADSASGWVQVWAGGKGGNAPRFIFDVNAVNNIVRLRLHTSSKFEIQDHLDNPIFRVDEDGDLHGLTGKALTFDL